MTGDRHTGGHRRRPRELVVADREELLFLLGEAAELEHAVCCSYLFAAFSLRTDPADGLAGGQLEAVTRWRRALDQVALQEMAHLALVNNLLAAVGGAPHLGRGPFPRRVPYAPEITLALTPLDEPTLHRFLYIERPEGMDLAEVAGRAHRAHRGRRVPAPVRPPVLPGPQEFDSLGGLYRGLERGLAGLVDRYGEAGVFVGSRRSQSAASLFAFPADLPELLPVTGLASARRAIDMIVAEGEGARGDWSSAHFGRFLAMLGELRALREQDPGFAPARPVAPNPHVRDPRDLLRAGGWRHPPDLPVSLVDDPDTVGVSDLFDACYAVLLRLLERLFQHGAETTAELRVVADAAVEVMWAAIRPLGELLTRLPAGPGSPGHTAGPGFRLDGWTPVTAHRTAAWAVLAERLAELAAAADRLAPVSPVLPAVAAALARLSPRFTSPPTPPPTT